MASTPHWAVEDFVAGKISHNELSRILHERDTGMTALHFAAVQGSTSTVQSIDDSKAVDVDIETSEGSTPLQLAAKNGHLEVVAFLLAAGARTEVKDGVGQNARTQSAQAGHWRVVALLDRVSDDKSSLKAPDGLCSEG